MHCNLVLKNYRCFDDSNPARIEIRPGFTAFVGPNNSGKSSLLRFFYENRQLFGDLSGAQNIAGLLRGSRGAGVIGVNDPLEIFSRNNERDISISFEFPEATTPNSIKSIEIIRLRNQPNAYNLKLKLQDGSEFSARQEYRTEHIDSYTVRVYLAPNQNTSLVIDCKEFVTTMQELHQFIYIGPFRNSINRGSSAYYDISVGSEFINVWDNWKHGNSLHQKRQIQRVIDDIKTIFRFKSLEIEASADKSRLDFTIDDEPFVDSELGAGLSEFVITLGAVATRDASLVLIDEPEIHLHPALQADYLTSLGSYARHGAIFSTHSIGLARTADSIYSCHSLGRSTEVKPFGGGSRLSEFLGEMSFSSYSELGFKKILLVEGPSDLRVIQQWLRLKHKDHEIVMLCLSGDSLANKERALELEEIRRVHPDVYALVDSERDAAGGLPSESRRDFEKICNDLKIPVHLTDRRALDNYLTDRAVKAVKGPGFSALTEFAKLRDMPNGWGKSENWKIARAMTWSEIESTDVGQFLNKHIIV